MVKATSSQLHPGGLVTQIPPVVNAAGEGVHLRRNFLILKQMFNVQWDFTWQCIFHGHLQDISQHPFTPPQSGLKMALQPAEHADTLPK